MATFTWTATIGNPTSSWATPSDWVGTTGNPTSFTTSPGNDYVVNSSNALTLNNIGAGGTASPDIANSITVSDVQASLLMTDGGALDVATTLSLSRLLNMGTTTGGSVLGMGTSGGAGGTITLGSGGEIEGALGDTIQNLGTTPTEIMGSGTILAEAGTFNIGTGVQVASTGATGMKFQIGPNANLSFADAVGGGTIIFTGSISSVLDVSVLSSFNASVKDPFIGIGANKATAVLDFINAGTAATATLSGNSTTGATLTVFSNGTSHTIPMIGNFTTVGASSPGKFVNVNYVSDGHGGTDIFLTDTPCYAAGTAILTPDGEVPVETIRAGDAVMILEDGAQMPRRVMWAGVRRIDLERHPKPATVAPIRFLRSALGPDQPRRDLLLSPDHCVWLDGGLVPARLLINGMTIVRDLSLAAVSYHHLELERHALLLAEGVAAESYLDTGNRAWFGNAGLAMIEHPEFGVDDHPRCWETDACAPLLTRPEQVRPIWQRLADRAVTLGFVPAQSVTTDDPDITLTVDGRSLRPIGSDAGTVTFPLPAVARQVRLRSRAAAPREIHPWQDDPRSLGVAVRSFRLRDRSGETVLAADHPALIDGWHAAEHGPDGPWRWSDGDAVLPIALDGPCLLTIDLGGVGTYPAEAASLAG